MHAGNDKYIASLLILSSCSMPFEKTFWKLYFEKKENVMNRIAANNIIKFHPFLIGFSKLALSLLRLYYCLLKLT